MANEIKIVVTAENKTTAATAGATAGMARFGATVQSITDDAKRRIDELNSKEIRLRADITQVELKLAELRKKAESATGDVKIKIDADIASAEAREAELRRQLASIPDAKVKVEAQTASAIAKLEETKRKAAEAARDRRFTVAVDTAGSVGKVMALVSAVAALIPVAVAASGALAGIGAVGVVGLGAVIGGFTGVGDALTAMGQKAASGGGAVTSNASAVRGATRGVEAANRDLRDSYEAVSDAAHTAAIAHRSVADAEVDVEDAAYSLSQAVAGVTAAQQRVSDSEYTYERALTDERRAQESVTDARKAALRTLQDLEQQTKGAALSQEDAALSVAEAEARKNEVMQDPRASDLERQRADLSVRMARQRQEDLSISTKRLAEDKAVADQKGVDGSDQVVAAQQRVVDAQDRVAASSRAVQDARDGVADAEHRVEVASRAVEAAQRRVTDAQYEATQADKGLAKAKEGVTLASQRLKDAQLELAEAMKKVGGGAGGVDKVAEAMKKLGPNGKEFVKFMKDFIDNDLAKLRKAGQEEFLPGIQAGLEKLKPIMADLRPTFEDFSRIAGKALGDLIPIAGSLAEPFLKFATASMQGLQPLEPVLQTLATNLGAVFDKMTASGDATKAMGSVVDILSAVLSILPPLVEAGNKLMISMGPDLATTFDNLALTVKNLLPGIEAMAPAVGAFLVQVSGALATIADFTSKLLEANPQIVTTALTVGAAMFAFQKLRPVIDGVRTAISMAGTAFGGTKRDIDGVEQSTTRGHVAMSRLALGYAAAGVAATAMSTSASVSMSQATKDLEAFATTGNKTSDLFKNLDFDLKTIGSDEMGTRIADAFEHITFVSGVLDQSIQHVHERFASMDAALAGMVSSGNAAQAAAAFRKLADEAKAQGVPLDKLKAALPQYKDALDAAGLSADGTAGSIDKLTDAARKNADQFMSTEQANIGYEDSLARVKESLDTNGRTLNIHTEAGRANRTALLDLVTASQSVIEKMEASNAPIAAVSAEHEAQRKKLVDLAVQMGMTRAQAQTYIDKLLQVPKSVSTKAALDTKQALADLQNLQNKLAGLNGVLTVTPKTGTQGQGAGVYKSTGGWVGQATSRGAFGSGPKGRDTVPGWLDPEEFVVRADVARKNAGLLQALNSGGDVQGQLDRITSGPSMARGGGGGAAPVVVQGGTPTVVLEFHGSNGGLDDLFFDWLRRGVRTRGGNVQIALGAGAAA